MGKKGTFRPRCIFQVSQSRLKQNHIVILRAGEDGFVLYVRDTQSGNIRPFEECEFFRTARQIVSTYGCREEVSPVSLVH